MRSDADVEFEEYSYGFENVNNDAIRHKKYEEILSSKNYIEEVDKMELMQAYLGVVEDLSGDLKAKEKMIEAKEKELKAKDDQINELRKRLSKLEPTL